MIVVSTAGWVRRVAGSRPLTWLPALVMGQAISSARSLRPLLDRSPDGGRSNSSVPVGAGRQERRVVTHPFLEHDGPLAIAHRGGALDGRENAMAAFA